MNETFSHLRSRALRIPALTILILSLSLTAIATYYAYCSKRIESEKKISEVALRLSGALDDRLGSYGDLLLDARGFMASAATGSMVNRESFSRFVENLGIGARYPGLVAIGYAPRVQTRDLPAFQRRVNKESKGDFRIWPAGARAQYTPVLFLAPYADAEQAPLGFDLSSDGDLQLAMDSAADSGLPTLSRRLPYLIEDVYSRMPGFLLFVPVYNPQMPQQTMEQRRQALLGFIYSPLRARELLDEMARGQKNLDGVGLDVYDGESEQTSYLLFSSNPEGLEREGVRRVLHKFIENHAWTVVVRFPHEILGELGVPRYLWVLLIGGLVSLVIYAYAHAAVDYSASLEKSQSLLSLITNSLPSFIGYVNRQHRYVYNNQGSGVWQGRSPHALLSQSGVEESGPTYDAFFKPLLDRAMTGERVSFEYAQQVHEDGGMGRRYFRGEYIPDLNSEGQIAGAVVVVNDQTEQKLAQDKLRDERRITELINEVGMSLQAELNAERLAQKITDVATELTGAEVGSFIYHLKPESADAATLFALSGPLKEQVVDRPELRLNSGRLQDEHILRFNDVSSVEAFESFCPVFSLRSGVGPMRSYLAAPVISRSGQVLGGLVFAHTRVEAFTDRAEKLIAGIAAQAAVALDNAKLYSESLAINRVKDEFLATLSHELRTPLNVILGYSELLREEDGFSDRVRPYIEAIHRSAKAQNQLIADLLDISAIITGKLGFQPVQMNAIEVVHAAIENIRFAAETKGVTLRSKVSVEPCLIIGDPTRVQQIVWNLLSNAIKFTPKGGLAEISVGKEDDGCVIQVKDSGIGIDKDFLPYVFDRFSQEDSSRSRRFGGLGLGLSIVRQLVELHGGHIRVESEGKNCGASFTVALPLVSDVQMTLESVTGAGVQKITPARN